MSKMETDTKEWLLTMIRVHRRMYPVGGQARIASWSVKTALIAGCRFNQPSHPASIRTSTPHGSRARAPVFGWGRPIGRTCTTSTIGR
jgi:hypothetical protein